MTYNSTGLKLECLQSMHVTFPRRTSLDQLMTSRYEVSDRRMFLERFPIALRCSQSPIRIELLECYPSGCSTKDILLQLGRMNLTPATVADVLFVLGTDESCIDPHPALCIGSIWTDTVGAQYTPLINYDPSRLLLSLFALEDEWWDPCMIFGIRQ
jgi:hypothetical protein